MEVKEDSIDYLMQVKESKERLEQYARDLKSLIVKADDMMIVRHHKKQLKHYMECLATLKIKCNVILSLVKFEDEWTNDYIDFADLEVINSLLTQCDKLVKIQEAQVKIMEIEKESQREEAKANSLEIPGQIFLSV